MQAMPDARALGFAQRVNQRLNEAPVGDFRRQGAIVIRRLPTPDELATLREDIEANSALPSVRAKIASRPDDPGRFFEDFCNRQHNAACRRVIFESPLALAAQRLMSSHTVRLHHDHLLVKEPGTRQRTPWHQDQPYYNIDGRQNVSIWIPVDPASRASTLEFVVGSHRGPWLMPRTFMDQQAKWFSEGSLADLPDIESERERFPIVGWALEPCDIVCFDMLTLHAAGGGAGSNRRRVFNVRFLGEDIRHALRGWATSSAFPGPVRWHPVEPGGVFHRPDNSAQCHRRRPGRPPHHHHAVPERQGAHAPADVGHRKRPRGSRRDGDAPFQARRHRGGVRPVQPATRRRAEGRTLPLTGARTGAKDLKIRLACRLLLWAAKPVLVERFGKARLRAFDPLPMHCPAGRTKSCCARFPAGYDAPGEG